MKINRRNFLISTGAFLALPNLNANETLASSVQQRLVFLGVGFGFTQDFYPKDFGDNYELTSSLKPLEKNKKDFTMVANLWNKFSRDPHSGSVTYLTGANLKGATSSTNKNSISCDQLAAQYLGKDTRFPSIQLTSLETNSGYGGGASLSWDAKGNSMSGLESPLKLYNMLFGNQSLKPEETIAMLEKKKSLLDSLVSGMKSLNNRASKMDRERLDQYYQSIREVELRISKEKLWAYKPKPQVNYEAPAGNMNGEAEIKAMYDLIILALQTDLTRVVTYRLPLQSLLRSLGSKLGPHQVSHYNKDPDRKRDMLLREKKEAELLSYFIDQLKSKKETDGSSMFDNCLVSYGSNIRDWHILKSVPAFIAGNIRGKIKHGQHIKMPKDTPLCNLWLTLLQTMGIPEETFSDSTGTINELLV